MSSPIFKAFVLAAAMVVAASAGAQQVADIGFKSVGRAAPLAADLTNQEIVGAGFPIVLATPGDLTSVKIGDFIGSARDGQSPEGVTPLAVDLYTTKDFYKDKDLWTDPRYFRCNSPVAIEEQYGANGPKLIGEARRLCGLFTAKAWGFSARSFVPSSRACPMSSNIGMRLRRPAGGARRWSRLNRAARLTMLSPIVEQRSVRLDRKTELRVRVKFSRERTRRVAIWRFQPT